MPLLSDHKTLTATRGHDAAAVPHLIYDSHVDTRSGGGYDEAAGVHGAFEPNGAKLLRKLFESEP